MEMVVTTGAIRRAKLYQIVTANKPTRCFLHAEFLSCCPTISIGELKGTVSHSTLTSISPGDFPALTLTTAGYIGGKIWSVKDTEDKRGGSNEGQDDTKPADEHGAEFTNSCEGQRDSQPTVDDTQTER